MRLLDAAPRFLFFAGKAGIGKTSVSCAAAIHQNVERASKLLPFRYHGAEVDVTAPGQPPRSPLLV
jgi:predicted ribonuclease YlaK